MAELQQLQQSSEPVRDGGPLPVNAFSRLRTRDMGVVQKHSGATFGSLLPRIDLEEEDASFHFAHNQLDLPHSSIHILDYHCEKSAVRLEMPPMAPFLLLQFSLMGEAELTQDGETHVLRPGQLRIVHGDSPLNGRLLPGYRSMLFLVARSTLTAALSEQLGRRPERPLVFDSTMLDAGCLGDTVQSLTMAMWQNVEGAGPAALPGAVTKTAEDFILSLILWSLPHNYRDELEEHDTVAPYYVRRVERFVQAHARDVLCFGDLVQVSGVSERTLQDGFRRYRRTTPMSYVRNVRLELARKSLLDAPRQLVTEVAMDCGFSHLGKFAIDYRERFGERPSETLRRGRVL